MNSLDLYLLFPVAAGLVIGLFRGLIKEVISIIVILLGIYFSRLFTGIFSSVIASIFDISPETARPLSFIVIFVVIAITLMILGRILHKALKILSLGFLNALAGGLFGAIKFALLISILLNVGAALSDKLELLELEDKEQSLLYEPMKSLAPRLWKEIKNEPAIQ